MKRLLLLLIGLLSCKKDPCVPNNMTAQVRFTAPKTQTLTDLTLLDEPETTYTLKARNDITRYGEAYVIVPLNLNSNQTRLTYQIRNQVDTLILTYDFTTLYLGIECGYGTIIQRRAGQPLARSTAGKAQAMLARERTPAADTIYGSYGGDYSQLQIRISL